MSVITMAPPRTGWLKGTFANQRAELNFDRTAQTVKGELQGSTVDLSIDHDQHTVTGSANGRPVDLTFDWTPQHVHYQGRAQGTNVTLDVDYPSHSVKGQVGSKAVDITFSEQTGKMQGTAAGTVDLTNQSNGQLNGLMAGKPLNGELVNVDQGQFLSYVYLFAPGVG